jgi:hypothetical protein
MYRIKKNWTGRGSWSKTKMYSLCNLNTVQVHIFNCPNVTLYCDTDPFYRPASELFFFVTRECWIIYREQAFSPSNDLAPRLSPLPTSPVSKLKQRRTEKPRKRGNLLAGKGVGVEPNHTTARKPVWLTLFFCLCHTLNIRILFIVTLTLYTGQSLNHLTV